MRWFILIGALSAAMPARASDFSVDALCDQAFAKVVLGRSLMKALAEFHGAKPTKAMQDRLAAAAKRWKAASDINRTSVDLLEQKRMRDVVAKARSATPKDEAWLLRALKQLQEQDALAVDWVRDGCDGEAGVVELSDLAPPGTSVTWTQIKGEPDTLGETGCSALAGRLKSVEELRAELTTGERKEEVDAKETVAEVAQVLGVLRQVEKLACPPPAAEPKTSEK